jgi:zinc transport system ATP-binding protein
VVTSTEEIASAQAPAAEAPLRSERLVIGHGGRALLPPIDAEIRRGEVLVVVGRNGAGKTTWFKTLLGLIPPVSGRVVRASPSLRLAYVPQSTSVDDLLPVRTRDLVGWGRLSGWSFLWPFSAGADHKACARALEAAGAVDLGQRFYRELSRGQKQRALFARVLAREADVALLDEPTAAMDAVAEREAMEELRRLARERNVAVVVVSHALSEACCHADRILFFREDPPEVVLGERAHVLAHEAFKRDFGDVVTRDHH